MTFCYFVTGATGVVGSGLVPKLLACNTSPVHILVRADSDAHLRERMKTLGAYWELDVGSLIQQDRLIPHRGDVCQPSLALGQQEFERLAKEITHVVHAAGTVRLNCTLPEARSAAVGGLENVLNLCRRALEYGVFQKLDYLSTVGVLGRQPGVLLEERIDTGREFHNTYEQAKAEAEIALYQEMDRDLPATIHRPSMVVGDSQTGKVLHFQVFYYLCDFLSGRRTWGIIPELGDKRLDTIPVDVMAEALFASTRNSQTIGRILHECSGPDDSIRLSQLVHTIRELLRSYQISVPKLRSLSRPQFQKLITIGRYFTGRSLRRRIDTLPHFLNYLAMDQAFSNHQSRTLLPDVLKQTPTPENYLPAVLTHWIKNQLA